MTIAMLDDGTVFHTPKDSEYKKINACARTIYVNVASANQQTLTLRGRHVQNVMI